MKKQPYRLSVYAILLGVVLVCVEVLALRGSAGAMVTGMLVGIGAGLAGGGLSGIITRKMRERATPEEQRLQEIMEHDERYQAMREKAGYGAWYITLLAITVLALVLVALDDPVPCFLALGLMAIHIIGYFVALAIVGRKM